MPSNVEIAEQLFTALSGGEIATAKALCAEDVVFRQNGGPASGFDAVGALTLAVRSVAPDFRYEDAIRVETTNGFVEEHGACGTLADGTEFRIPVCVVATVTNGLVSDLREYLDSAAATALFSALAPG